MSKGQIATVLLVSGVTVVYIAALLYIEYIKYKSDSKAIITRSFRAAVKKVPWVFILIALIFGFMAAHCFGQ